jgi:hypothetical protein
MYDKDCKILYYSSYVRQSFLICSLLALVEEEEGLKGRSLKIVARINKITK